MRTVITASYIIGYQGDTQRLLSPGCVVIDDDRVAVVDERYDGPAHREIDLPGRLISPGFVNLHLHAGGLALARLYADTGRPDLCGAGYLEYGAPRTPNAPDVADIDAGGVAAIAEAVRSGCTTIVEMGGETGVPVESLVAAAKALGVRLYTAPGYRSARYITNAAGRVSYEWDVPAGEAGLDAAVEFIRAHDGEAQGRIRGMLFPLQADTCTAALLARTMAAAEEFDVRVQIHASQSLFEVHEMLRREGRSPLHWLDDVGVLGPRTIVAHAMFQGAHPWTPYLGDDVARLARSGSTVAHCPVAMARRGVAFHAFSDYAARGVRLGLGTDTFPRDFISEMRWAAYLGRIAAADVNAVSSWQVFEAGTIAGADALGRPDLGRLAPGAKADLIAIDLRALHFGPVFDPISALVACGTAQDVELVMVDGRVVVEDRRVLGVDTPRLRDVLQKAAETIWRNTALRDWGGRSPETTARLADRRWHRPVRP